MGEEVGPTCVWGTWEELILGGAVMRHGIRDWNAVALELRARALHLDFFTPEVCKAKFEDLLKRYAGSTAWFEELRKQRMAELKRELARSEDSIGSLESKIKLLEAEKQNSNQADYDSPQTESPLPAPNSDGTESVCKDTLKDVNSAGSFTDETQTTTDWLDEHHNEGKEIGTKHGVSVSSKQDKELSMEKLQVEAGYGRAVTVRKRRGQRKRKNCNQVVKDGSMEESDNVGSSNAVSTAKRNERELAVKEGTVEESDSVKFSKGVLTVSRKNCKLVAREGRVRDSDKVESSNGVLSAKRKGCNLGIRAGHVVESDNIGSDNVVPVAKRKKCNQATTKVGSVEESGIAGRSNAALAAQRGTSTTANDQVTRKSGNDNRARVASPVVKIHNLMNIFQSIASSEPATVFKHRMDSQKRARYRMVVKQHLDISVVRSRITGESIKSTKELFRDLLLLANNALVFYSRRTREYKAALSLRNLVMKEYKQHCRESSKEATSAFFLLFIPPVKPRTARPRPVARSCREWASEKLPLAAPPIKEKTPCESDTNVSPKSLLKEKKGVKKPGKGKPELATDTQHKAIPVRHRKRVRK